MTNPADGRMALDARKNALKQQAELPLMVPESARVEP